MLTVKVYPDNISSPHLSQIYTGLFELEKQRKIRIKFTKKFPYEVRVSQPRISLWLNAKDLKSGKSRNICFDMHDSGKIFSVSQLQLCDVYYKRSYSKKHIDSLEKQLQKKIKPFGLNYPCSSKGQKHRLKRLLIYNQINHNLKKHPVKLLKESFYELLKTSSLILYPPLFSHLEIKPDSPSERKILFQTRLWEHNDKMEISARHVTKINEVRANTVCALRNEFGDHFVGGLYPTPFAKKNYPNCLTDLETDATKYLKLVKMCLIGVTTTGLHNSIGWKLAEYLAASRCIITEPLNYALPVSLVEGKNFLSFRTPEECVEKAKIIFNNQRLAKEMRKNNYDYYLTEIKPAVALQRCLDSPFKKSYL